MQLQKEIDYLEKEYGIKEDARHYRVLFKLEEIRHTLEIKGDILNFHPSQMIIKTNEGLFIIYPRNIIEMIPIKTKSNT